jgi:hypothetical protein
MAGPNKFNVEGIKVDADGKVVYEDWKLNEIIYNRKDFLFFKSNFRAWVFILKLL